MISTRRFFFATAVALTVGLVAGTWLASCHRPSAAPQAAGSTVYYCPMHPSYRSDRPGDCPICNMKLVPLGSGDPMPSASGVEGHASLTIDPDRRRLIGVRTRVVEKKRAVRTIRAAGRVEADERKLATVSLKVGGWIEDLRVKSVGERVKRGDPLLVLYSPELLEAQQTYIVARETLASLPPESPSARFANDSVRSARERLLLWDVTEDQVRALETSGKSERAVTIASKVSGVVTRRMATQGAFVEPGRDLYDVADLSTVWVLADVYEREIPIVAHGQDVSVTLASRPSEPLAGRVDLVYPMVDAMTRTARVRIEVPNPDLSLRPGTYATVSISVDIGEQLVIADDAVLDTGTRQIVFVDLGEGRLEPREVSIGDRSDGVAIVKSGLQAGERVVTSGNFLVDSESRLRAALSGDAHGKELEHP